MEHNKLKAYDVFSYTDNKFNNIYIGVYNTRLHRWEATLAALISPQLFRGQGLSLTVVPYSKNSVFPQIVEKNPDVGKIFYKHIEKVNLF